MQESLICDFTNPKCLKWHSVDDEVMGGVSESRFHRGDDGAGVFEGVLSTRNSGGFASVRTFLEKRDFSGFEGIRLLVKGDGRDYSFRIRNDDRYDGIVYRSDFQTVEGVWQEVDLPFNAFTASFRGRVIEDAAPLDLASIVQIGVLISKEQTGAFRLEMKSIRAYSRMEDALKA
jgi:NADH dehydrogenase [ubiquinone] 1 alpha subcomplex assembly factor 1